MLVSLKQIDYEKKTFKLTLFIEVSGKKNCLKCIYLFNFENNVKVLLKNKVFLIFVFEN